MNIIKILAVLSTAGAIAWTIVDPGFEPALAVIAGISASVAAFEVDNRRKKIKAQNQVVSGSSLGIQAGGDVSIGNGNESRKR